MIAFVRPRLDPQRGGGVGVLEIGSTAQREYTNHDINFLSSIANIAAAAVDKMKRDAALDCDDRLQDVMEEQRSSSEAANFEPDEVRRRRSWDRCRE